MPTPGQLQEWMDRLERAGVAGPHRSHSHHNNMGKLRRTLEGDPDCTFGLSGLERLQFDEALALMAAVTGWRPEEPTEYVDPELTVARAVEAGRFCRRRAAPGAEAIVATGHPDTLLPLLSGIAGLLEEAGMTIRQDLARAEVRAGWRSRSLEYEGKVACLADEWGAIHTHSPEGMRALLEAGGRPDLVVADHGWAGAAMEAGVPTVATLDTNDPALALGALRCPECVLIPLDDGRAPSSYMPVLEAFTAGFRDGA